MAILGTNKEVESIQALIALLKNYYPLSFDEATDISISGGPVDFECSVDGGPPTMIANADLARELGVWLGKYAGINSSMEIQSCDIQVPYEDIFTATIKVFICEEAPKRVAVTVDELRRTAPPPPPNQTIRVGMSHFVLSAILLMCVIAAAVAIVWLLGSDFRFNGGITNG